MDALEVLTKAVVNQPSQMAEILTQIAPLPTVVTGGNYHFPQPQIEPVYEIADRKSVSPKLELVMDWLAEHPEDGKLSNRKLADKLGVSHPWVAKAREVMQVQ